MSICDKVPDRGDSDPGREFSFSDCSFGEEFPGIYEFIARRVYKGKPRAGGRVLMYTENGKCNICVMDRYSGQVAFYAAETLSEGLQGVEEGLQTGKLDWRRDKRSR